MSLALSAAERSRYSLTFARGVEILNSDPLSAFRHQCEKAREFTRNLGRAEIYLHAANKFGKSTLGIATDLAICRAMRKLDGIPLPQVPMPARWGLFVPSYKAHRSSTQPIIERLVGDWPHHFERRGQDLVSVRIRPENWRDDDIASWSQYTVYSCENPGAGVGARLHGAGCDEPPPMPILRELRKAGEAASLFPLSIRGTPLWRSQWWPLREDYPDPMHNEGRILNGFLRLRGSVYENTALTPRDIRELERKYRNDPLRDARLHGIEINTEGASPFRRNAAELERWFLAAHAGRADTWRTTREVRTERGAELVVEDVQVEVWEDPIAGHRYRIYADPSLGIDDGEHDPGAAWVVDETSVPARDVAAYRGYIGEYGLGVLCAGLSAAYEDAMVDPDVTGGYGTGFLGGMRAAGCTRIVNDSNGRDPLDRADLGMTITSGTRADFMDALNEAMLASAQGSPWLVIRCPWVVSDLVDLVLKDGRPVTGDGMHDEGFIVAGRAASRLRRDAPPVVRRQRIETPRETGMRVLREDLGLRPVRREPPSATRRAPGIRTRGGRMNLRRG